MLCTQGSAENQLCVEWTPCLNITIIVTTCVAMSDKTPEDHLIILREFLAGNITLAKSSSIRARVNCSSASVKLHLSYRGFAERPLELKWIPFYRFSWDFLAFSAICGSTVSDVLLQNHRHYSDLIANQVCYAFLHVLSIFP